MKKVQAFVERCSATAAHPRWLVRQGESSSTLVFAPIFEVLFLFLLLLLHCPLQIFDGYMSIRWISQHGKKAIGAAYPFCDIVLQAARPFPSAMGGSSSSLGIA